MKSLKKIVGINLLILLVYSIWIRFASSSGSGSDKSLGILAMSAFAVTAHVVILLIIMGVYYSNGNKDMGKAYLLSSGIVLLIGFSACLGNASI